MGKRIFIGVATFTLIALFPAIVPHLFSQQAVILGKIGEKLITQEDFDELARKYSQMKKEKTFTPEEKKEILDNLVKGYLIIQDAENEKLDQSPNFKAKMKVYRNDLLMNEYIDVKLKPSVKVTEEELDRILKDNPNMLSKEVLKLKEILVKTEKEAEEIYEELKRGGNFSSIAVKKSIAPTNASGGNMKSPISRGQLPKPLEEVAFSLKKGETSKPIKTDQGFYILSLVDRKERTPEEIKGLSDRIKVKLRQLEEQRKLSDLVEKRAKELREKTEVQVFYDRIQ